MEKRYTALEWAAMEGGHELPKPEGLQLSFLQELTESRLFKNRDTLYGKTAEDLAKYAYIMFMMLEVLRLEQFKWAKKYAVDTLVYENFDAMRTSATDLHNVLAVLNNQKEYEDKIDIDLNVSVPVFHIKRYLRDIQNHRKYPSQDRQFFMSLETFLKIHDSKLRQLRRDVGDWDQNSKADKAAIHKMIKNYISASSTGIPVTSDLYTQFIK